MNKIVKKDEEANVFFHKSWGSFSSTFDDFTIRVLHRYISEHRQFSKINIGRPIKDEENFLARENMSWNLMVEGYEETHKCNSSMNYQDEKAEKYHEMFCKLFPIIAIDFDPESPMAQSAAMMGLSSDMTLPERLEVVYGSDIHHDDNVESGFLSRLEEAIFFADLNSDEISGCGCEDECDDGPCHCTGCICNLDSGDDDGE